MNANDYKELENLLALTWRKRNGEIDQGMVDHCLKTGKYIRIGDLFVSVCDRKPAIDTTIWYDDTTKGPDANFANFLHLNERNNMPGLWKLDTRYCGRESELYIRVQYNGDKTGGKLATLEMIPEGFARDGIIRKATPQDLEQINAAVQEVRDDYRKRLDAYWKRYGKTQVSSRGYWVDR
jgi:hypothetical protein